jgi:glycosyltransferase involved in cell wall biosynthesis
VQAPPVVSILVPAFNAAATLPACLRSITRQTFADWECIVVDDGSRDATRAIAERYAAQNPRFTVIAIPHTGLVGALNHGLTRCRGPYVARMDADDVMHRERIVAQVHALDRHPELVALGCHVRLFPRAPLTDGRRLYERWLNDLREPSQVLANAFVECPIAHPTLMIRRAAIQALRYRDPGWPEDYDLILRLLARGDQIGVLPRRLLLWRDDPARRSRTDAAYTMERFTACKAAFLANGFLAANDSYVLWGYGDTGRALRHALLAHGKRPSHIVEVHPGRLGNTIHGAPVIAPDALRDHRGARIIASVAGTEARAEIRTALVALGFREMVDFVCAA